MRPSAIVLVSGGLDSATALGWATTQFQHILPVNIYYGQRHSKETFAAEQLCDHYGLASPLHLDFSQPFAMIGGSSLTSGSIHGNPSQELVERTPSDLPPTFVPGRNMVFLAAVAGLGYVHRIYDIVGGWNAVDYSGYPDCRPEFFAAAERALGEALVHPLTIHTPLISLTKQEIIELGTKLDVPYRLTWSCYSGGGAPCGQCDSCVIRRDGFAAAKLPDPALTAATS